MNIPICPVCNKNPVGVEPRKNKPYFRKSCNGCRSAEWSQKNPKQRRVINDRYHKEYKKINANWKQQMMDHIEQHSCKYCLENNPVVLCFHHRNPEEKKFRLVWAYLHYYGIDSMKKEAEKCDVICSNCHLKIHATNFDKQTKNWLKKQGLLDCLGQCCCSKCGADDIRVLSFHHPGEKTFKISDGYMCLSLDALTAEALKCDLLCENCHRKLHHSHESPKD